MLLIRSLHAIPTVIFVCAFVLLSAPLAHAITYNLVSYSDYQNGYTLTGTITTDGHTGVLATSDIVSSSITVSNGVDTYQNLHPSDDFWTQKLMATDTELYLPMQIAATYSQHSWPGLFLGDGSLGTPQMQYDYFQYPDAHGIQTVFADFMCSVGYPTTQTFLWLTSPTSSLVSPPQLGTQLINELGGQPWVIAIAVPEPATLSLLITALLGVSGSMLARRRCSRCQ